jgi:UDP-N-acetylglucosamine--N-acetylmuramyl-(pentapeptide) pyrophosphoryl-undecaprenol N-acetylglucosamine transferase
MQLMIIKRKTLNFYPRLVQAVLMPQSQLTPQVLAEIISFYYSSKVLEMSNQALKKAKPFSTARVAEVCKEVSLA